MGKNRNGVVMPIYQITIGLNVQDNISFTKSFAIIFG